MCKIIELVGHDCAPPSTCKSLAQFVQTKYNFINLYKLNRSQITALRELKTQSARRLKS